MTFNKENKQPNAVSFKDGKVLVSPSSSCFPTSYIFDCWFAGRNQTQEKVGYLEKQSGSSRLKLAPKSSWFGSLWLCSFFAMGNMRKGILSHTGVWRHPRTGFEGPPQGFHLWASTFKPSAARLEEEEELKKGFKNYLMRGNNLTNIPAQNERWKLESVIQGLNRPGIEYWLSLQGILAVTVSGTEHDWARPDPWALAGKSHLNASSSHGGKGLWKEWKKTQPGPGKEGALYPRQHEQRPWGRHSSEGRLWHNGCHLAEPVLNAWGWDLMHEAFRGQGVPDVTPRVGLSNFKKMLCHSAWSCFHDVDLNKIGVSGWGYKSMVAFLVTVTKLLTGMT